MLSSDELALLREAQRGAPVYRPKPTEDGLVQWVRVITLLRGLKRQGLVRFSESLGPNGQVLLLGPVELTEAGREYLAGDGAAPGGRDRLRDATERA